MATKNKTANANNLLTFAEWKEKLSLILNKKGYQYPEDDSHDGNLFYCYFNDFTPKQTAEEYINEGLVEKLNP